MTTPKRKNPPDATRKEVVALRARVKALEKTVAQLWRSMFGKPTAKQVRQI